MSSKSLGKAPTLKCLSRVVLKTMNFLSSAPPKGKRTTRCKVNIITLKYENSKVVNFTTLSRMILEDDTPLHVYNSKKIKRKHSGVVVSEP